MATDGTDLDELARAFAVRTQGSWRDVDVAAFTKSLRSSPRAPGHVNATAARKILTRSARGYLEPVEIQSGEGEFETYSTIELSLVPRTVA